LGDLRIFFGKRNLDREALDDNKPWEQMKMKMVVMIASGVGMREASFGSDKGLDGLHIRVVERVEHYRQNMLSN